MNTAIYSSDTILFNLHMMTLIYRWNDTRCTSLGGNYFNCCLIASLWLADDRSRARQHQWRSRNRNRTFPFKQLRSDLLKVFFHELEYGKRFICNCSAQLVWSVLTDSNRVTGKIGLLNPPPDGRPFYLVSDGFSRSCKADVDMSEDWDKSGECLSWIWIGIGLNPGVGLDSIRILDYKFSVRTLDWDEFWIGLQSKFGPPPCWTYLSVKLRT